MRPRIARAAACGPSLACLLVALGACGGGGTAPADPAGSPGTTAGADGPAAGPFDEPSAAPGPAASDASAPEAAAVADEAPVAVPAAPPPFEPAMRAILRGLPVSSSQYVAQQTPIDTANGAVYVANAEPGANGDGNGVYVDTVVRRGTRGADGAWRWTAAYIEGRTVYDRWHTLPSVGVDKGGRLHVAYNMHNFPWQYGRFAEPDSIEGFRFLGDPISDAELRLHVEQNRTRFEGPGSAAVPGTQVTYPGFFRDRRGELYLGSRQAARPARDFPERTMSAAAARLDAGSGRWSPVGAPLALDPGDVVTDDGSLPAPVVLAARTGWTAYAPSLEFDAAGRLHALWFWRDGIAGRELERPCVLVRHGPDDFRFPDGSPATLPVRPEACAEGAPGGIGEGGDYLSVFDTAMDSTGRFHAVLTPRGGERQITWTEAGIRRRAPSPELAGEIFFDAEDNLWAVADGPVLHRRAAGTDFFEPVVDARGDDRCFPRAALSEDRRRAYVHARGCDDDLLNVYEIDLLPRD